MLGDEVSSALATIGVTPERVSSWLGRPCGCEERKQKLNQLDAWARRIVRGKIQNGKEYLLRILSSE